MKASTLFYSLILTCFLAIGQTDNLPQPVNIDWLKGDQPKLLTTMANSVASRESLNGSKLSITAVLGGWHAQAVGQYKEFIYVAFSDGKLLDPKTIQEKKDQSDSFSKIWIYNTKTQESQLKDLIKDYPHPCSIQVTGNYLTIAVEAGYGAQQGAGIERSKRSMALIFDLSKDPYCSVEAARVVQDETNSGGAGLAYHPVMRCWYLFLDQDDYGKVAIYKTSNSNIDSWSKEPIGYFRRHGSGAGLNLITASDNSIWGLYYDTSEENLPTFSQWFISGDQVKLYKLIEPDGTVVPQRTIYTQVVSIESPKLKAAGEVLADRPGMRFGAGIRNENGKLELLTCQRNMNNTFYIDRKVLETGNRSQVMFTNLSSSKGEVYFSSLSNASQTSKNQSNQTESWTGVFQSPVKGDVNYLGLEKKGFVSVPTWKDAFEAQTSAPIALFYIEGTTTITGKMVEFSSKKNTDKKMN